MSRDETGKDILRDGFSRIREGVRTVVDGLSAEELLWQPEPDGNHMAWLVWHLARQEDEQVAHLAGGASAWVDGGWAEQFGLPYPAGAHGYGMTGEDVRAFTLSDPSLLAEYHGVVHDATMQMVDALTVKRLTEIIDPNWDPPVTVSVRLMSVLEDAAKHLGQAEYLRGLVLAARV